MINESKTLICLSVRDDSAPALTVFPAVCSSQCFMIPALFFPRPAEHFMTLLRKVLHK